MLFMEPHVRTDGGKWVSTTMSLPPMPILEKSDARNLRPVFVLIRRRR